MSHSTRNSRGPPGRVPYSRPDPAGGAEAGDGVGRCEPGTPVGGGVCALAGIMATAPAPAAAPSAAPMKFRRLTSAASFDNRPESLLDSRLDAARSLLLLILETPRKRVRH